MTEAELIEILRQDGEMVTERLDLWASTTGERTFFYYGEDDLEISYRDFAQRANSIAGNLAANGIVKGDHVSVYCRNSLVSALAMFGIWKAGGVYCPINFSYSGRTLEYQLNDTKPSILITEAQLVAAVNDVADLLEQPPIVIVYAPPAGAHDHDIASPPLRSIYPSLTWTDLTKKADAPDITLSFSDTANLIYTSGTTGLAKGVLQPHRWMALYTRGARMMLTSEDVVYNDLPLYHVGGAIANVCRAAWVGCEVAVWNRFSPDNFWPRVRSRRATAAILLDVMIPWLTNAPARPDDHQNTLKLVNMQPLPLDHALVARRFGFDYVTTGFGQTESGASISAVIEELSQGDGTPPELYIGRSHDEIAEIAKSMGANLMAPDQVLKKGLMGKPTIFVEVSIRNEQDEECAIDEIGQLALRPRLPGQFLHSYWGKPEATATAFRNLWFHTGDGAYLGTDGMYYFADRLGDRIRVRGENLSSAQVEDLLGRHPKVQMCAVIGIPSRQGNEDDVVAFVVPSDGATLDDETLRIFAIETMPKFMRPKYLRIVAELPRTPTNKVEKYKLRQYILEEISTEPSDDA